MHSNVTFIEKSQIKRNTWILTFAQKVLKGTFVNRIGTLKREGSNKITSTIKFCMTLHNRLKKFLNAQFLFLKFILCLLFVSRFKTSELTILQW